MLKANYHTHCKRCRHAEGNVIDYIDKAYEYGYEEIGMTDHNPILKSFMKQEEYIHNYCQETMDISEIDDYLNKHDCESFVILDDISWDLEKFGENLILTDPMYGITSKDADEAIRLLNKKENILNL